MPAERLSMRKVREVLRLRHALSLSYREISEALGVDKTAAGEIVRRAEVVGLIWPLPEVFDDGELERRLFTAPSEAPLERPAPDWAQLHEEMKRRSVTLVLLWQEYRAEHTDGYGYSRYCDLYGEWRKTISATMRQTHPTGEKLFVDYAGDTVAVFDQTNSTERPAHIFVAARLRNRRFLSLEQLNVDIRECVTDLNNKVMRKIGKSRAELLETIERPALGALPAEPYRYAEWKKCLVAPDYHVEVNKHYYS